MGNEGFCMEIQLSAKASGNTEHMIRGEVEKDACALYLFMFTVHQF